MSTNECNVNSILLRDKNLISKQIPKLTSKNLINLSKNAINRNAIESDEDATGIPKKITIFAGDVKDLSSEFSINALSTKDIEIHKLSRYIFPREDLGPTEAGKLEIPALRSLEYAINLACHKVDADVKEHWDTLCNRDVSYPEVSKNGIIATKYDLKNQSSIYKKQMEKQRYVEFLANNPDLDILAKKSIG